MSKAQTAQQKGASILVATPILSPEISSFHCDGLLEMYFHAPPKTRFARRHAFQRDIVRARSRLARQLLESDCTHLLYVDGDNVPNSAALSGMLRANKPVVACPYPRREIHPPLRPGDLTSCLRYSYIPFSGATVDDRECVQILGIGFGFILIQREVIEKLTKACTSNLTESELLALNGSDLPDEIKARIRLVARNTFVDDFPGNNNTVTTTLFSLYNSEDGKILGEDYSFCARCRDEGIKVHMYLGKGSPVEHDGMMRFGEQTSPGVVVTDQNRPLPIAEAHRSDDP